jgi:hypothetical protein
MLRTKTYVATVTRQEVRGGVAQALGPEQGWGQLGSSAVALYVPVACAQHAILAEPALGEHPRWLGAEAPLAADPQAVGKGK